MEKMVEIEGTEIGLKASAGTVRVYRDCFVRDLIVDMGTLEAELLQQKGLSPESVKIAENVIWVMAHEYDPSIPVIQEWLDQFSPYFIYNAIVQAIYMWRENTATINDSKKK